MDRAKRIREVGTAFRPCVVVPVFDHAESMAALALLLAPLGLKIFMINDGSGQSARAILHNLADSHDWIEVLDHATNQGKGAAVLTGLRAAYEEGYSHAVQIDADGQHDPGDIPKFLKLARENPRAIITGRPQFDGTAPTGRLIARYLTHVWVWIETLSFTIQDSMCGFRVYPLEPVIGFAASARLGRRMDFDTEILVKLYWEGLAIHSVSTRVTYPQGGRSHFRLWQDNCLISWMHSRLVFGMLWRVMCFRLRRPDADVPYLEKPR
jgi:glycosyltransferase involved in cell wall biosynthesis